MGNDSVDCETVYDVIIIESFSLTTLKGLVEKLKGGFLIQDKDNQDFILWVEKRNKRALISTFVEKVEVNSDSQCILFRGDDERDTLEVLDNPHHKTIDALLDESIFSKIKTLKGFTALESFLAKI